MSEAFSSLSSGSYSATPRESPEALRDAGPERLSEARNMREAFDLLRGYPMIEDFLAYQYVTDLNRSSLCSQNVLYSSSVMSAMPSTYPRR
jgi:hypothetical protein